MEIIINITDKIHKEIVSYCDLNGLTLDDYICNCIKQQFTIDKYGDLNQIFGTKIVKETKQDEVTTDALKKQIQNCIYDENKDKVILTIIGDKILELNAQKIPKEKKTIITTDQNNEEIVINNTVSAKTNRRQLKIR